MLHPAPNADLTIYTGNSDDRRNYFDEQLFAHTTNGTLLAILPEHITVSEYRRLGSIPAVLKGWQIYGTVCQLVLVVKGRDRETIFRVDCAAGDILTPGLSVGMTLYMQFRWDKVQEYPATKHMARPYPR